MAFRALVAALVLIPSVAAAGDFFTLKGHGGPIKGIDVSPDGGRILTASFDFSVGLWRGKTPVWLEAHRAAVNAVRFVDRDRAVSAGDDFQLYLWDLRTGEGRRLGGHQNKVHALELSPDGKTVAAASVGRLDRAVAARRRQAALPQGPPLQCQRHRLHGGRQDALFGLGGRHDPHLGPGQGHAQAVLPAPRIRRQHAGAERRGGNGSPTARSTGRSGWSIRGDGQPDRRLHLFPNPHPRDGGRCGTSPYSRWATATASSR